MSHRQGIHVNHTANTRHDPVIVTTTNRLRQDRTTKTMGNSNSF